MGESGNGKLYSSGIAMPGAGKCGEVDLHDPLTQQVILAWFDKKLMKKQHLFRVCFAFLETEIKISIFHREH